MALTLHRVARTYGTDPWSVLAWSPERLSMAMVCLRAADDATRERARTSKAQPSIDVGW